MTLISTLTTLGYQLTDIDNILLCKKIDEHTFECRKPDVLVKPMVLNDISISVMNDPNRWKVEIIDVNNYDEQTIVETINAHGYENLNELEEIYGEDRNRIIAEYLFDMEMI